MCLDEQRSITVQANAMLTPIEARHARFLRGNVIEVQLVAVARLARFGNMAMRQTRVSIAVERADLDAHLVELFGENDSTNDRRSYQDRYDALHRVDATPPRASVAPRSPLDSLWPLIKLTSVACLVGTVLLYLWTSLLPAQVARLRATELRIRRERRRAVGGVAANHNAVSSVGDHVGLMRRKRGDGAAAAATQPTRVDDGDDEDKWLVDAMSVSDLLLSAVRRRVFGTRDEPPPPAPPAATVVVEEPAVDPEPADVPPQPPQPKQPVERHVKQSKSPQSPKKKAQVPKKVHSDDSDLPPMPVAAPSSPTKQPAGKRANKQGSGRVKLRAATDDTPPMTRTSAHENSPSSTPDPTTPRALSPGNSVSSTNSELDPADATPVPESPANVDKPLAPVVEQPFAAPPGIGDSMRARAILPIAVPAPVPYELVQWQMQQMLLQQLMAENAAVAAQLSAMQQRQSSAAVPPPGFENRPRAAETIGDVFGAELFSLDDPQQQAASRRP
jgi:hypothetical protein